MTTEELVRRLRDPEDNFVERKPEGVSPAELRKTVSAFANTIADRHGILFVGVHDKTGEILGVDNPEALQKRVDTACTGDCYPPILYSCIVFQETGKSVMAVVIAPSSDKPHFTGPAFVRMGSSSKKASKAQFDELIYSRMDKCREILRHKDTGLVTVRTIDYQLGSKQPMRRPYLARTECAITDCTSHILKLYEPATGRRYSESMRGVDIGYDDEKWRLMLIIRFPPLA